MTTSHKVLAALSVLAVAVLGVLALAVAPADARQGDAQRLMYVHVPTAWLAYLAFFVTAVASVLWLWPRTRSTAWDLLAGASAEIGVLFAGLTLVLGSLWGRPIWGTWWEWDARVTTTAILFFLYLGYLALRRTGATAAERGTRSAVAALIAFGNVPIVHFSVTWWETLHQDATVLDPDLDVDMHGFWMPFTLVWSVLAFTLLYAALVQSRLRLAELEEGREEHLLELAIAERIRDETAVPEASAREAGIPPRSEPWPERPGAERHERESPVG
ncbi:MAG: cytochrome c biogenesis protein CcsA [Actinomycetota bacterium]